MNLLDIVDNSLKQKTINLVIGALLVSNSISAQIWQEDFSTYADNATTAVDNRLPAGVDWSINIAGATNIPPGYFSVQSNIYEAFDTQGEVIWTSEAIDISTNNRVYVTVDAISEAANNDDTLRVYYKIDGGAEMLFGTLIGSFADSPTFGAYALQGNSIEIIVKVDTDNDPFFGIFNDFLRFDNVTVAAQTELYSIANADWDANGTWSVTSGGASCACQPVAADYIYIESPYTVNLDVDVTNSGIEIANGATLRWTANSDFILQGGAINIDATGTLDQNVNTGNINIATDNASVSVVNNGSTNISNIIFSGAGASLTISGSSSVNLSADISFENNNCTLTNNGTIDVGNDFIAVDGGFFAADNDNSTLVNSGIITISGDINGPTYTFGVGDVFVNNTGTLTLLGTIIDVDAGSTFSNFAGGTWVYEGTGHDTDMQLYCNLTGSNLFSYTLGGNQDVITPQDSYWNLSMSGSGIKSLAGSIQVNGDLTVSGASLDAVTNTATVTLGGNIAQTVAGTITFYGLTANNTFATIPQIISTNDITLTNALTLTDGIIQAAGTVIVESAATSTGTSAASYIDGLVRKTGNTDFVFPIGDGNVWARAEVTSISNADAILEAQYFDTGYTDVTTLDPASTPGLSNVSTIEYWDISENSGNNRTAVLRLYWEDDTRSQITDVTDLSIAKYDVSLTPDAWTNVGTAYVGTDNGDGSGNVISTGGINFSSPLTFGSILGNNPLPIDLISFTGRQVNDAVQLIWKTATELNNDFFTLKRSYDGQEFKTVKIIKGNGTSSDAIKYEHEDYPLFSGIIYYRLSQTDFDGTSETFNIIAVNYEMNSKPIQVYPNPVTDNQFTVLLPSNPKGVVLVKIYSLTGKLMYTKDVIEAKNPLILKLENNHNRGLHILVIETETTRFRTKLFLE